MSDRFAKQPGAVRRYLLTVGLGSAMLLQVNSGLAQEIGTKDLLKPTWSGGLVPNSAFVPSPQAAAARDPFVGRCSWSRWWIPCRGSVHESL